ncbi:hypothetical protein [Streptococcus marmotae]|nr:hypothetical protein [Streptococcus marmotae]
MKELDYDITDLSLLGQMLINASTDTDSGASEGYFGSKIKTDADSGASIQ